jgi:aminomethyltransferase
MEGKKTPLYETHVKAGGKIVEFGGWLLPVQYADGIIAEHKAVRNQAGLFDVSHMGEILVEGPEALPFLQKLLTNDFSDLTNEQVRYSPMCYPDGGVVDDLLVYQLTKTKYILVVNAANTDKDWDWMNQEAKGFKLELTNLSSKMAELALQGPKALTILHKLTNAPIRNLGYYYFIPKTTVAGKPVMLSRTGYTGEDGFEIYCEPEDAAELWTALMEAGKEEGLVPAGLGCRDTLRFEACMPLYGHEMSDRITPLMAGLGSFVKLDKPDFNGKAALKAQKEQGLPARIMGVELTGRGVARAGFPVKSEGKVIGHITTGSPAPTLGKNMGLALIDTAYAKVGSAIAVDIRGRDVAALIVKKPFYKRAK